MGYTPGPNRTNKPSSSQLRVQARLLHRDGARSDPEVFVVPEALVSRLVFVVAKRECG
ncbi:MAG TPA: hypothetical protein PLC99_00605 [Verrucomicrobiota bacterium]|nr:hypothetical protein [Verrucomicrobiota bacterium]